MQDLFLDTHGVKLGFMSAFVKAASDALQKVAHLHSAEFAFLQSPMCHVWQRVTSGGSGVVPWVLCCVSGLFR